MHYNNHRKNNNGLKRQKSGLQNQSVQNILCIRSVTVSMTPSYNPRYKAPPPTRAAQMGIGLHPHLNTINIAKDSETRNTTKNYHNKVRNELNLPVNDAIVFM